MAVLSRASTDADSRGLVRWIRAHEAATTALSTSDSLAQAAQRLTEALGEHLELEAVSFWSVEEGALRPRAAWQKAGTTVAREASTDELRRCAFASGRVESASGPPSTLAVPLVAARGRVVGVIDIVTQRRADGEPGLLSLLTSVGQQVGAWIEREDALRAAKRESEARGAILASALDCIITIDARGSILEFNPAAERTFGYRRDEAIGREMADLIVPPQYREGHRRGLQRHLETGQASVVGQRLELQAMRKDGSVFPCEIAIVPLPSAGALRFTGFLRDLTAAHRAEAARAESEARLAAFYGGLPIALFATSPDGRFLQANAAFAKILGFNDHGRLLSTPVPALYADPRKRDEVMALLLRDGTVTAYETEFVRADGRRIWVSIHARLIKDAHGNVQRFEGALEDITERKRSEEELRRRGALLAWQRRVLEKIAIGAPLAETLDVLCRDAEERASRHAYSVLLVDEDGKRLRHGAAPSLPDHYNAAVDGIAIGEGVGSCGTAAHRKAPVLVHDIAEDPLWKDFRALALPLGLRACWSTPILSTEGALLGTWAVYSREPGDPTPEDEETMAIATRLASIAMQNARGATELERVKHHLELIVESAGEGIYGVDATGITTFMNRAALDLLGLTTEEAVGHRLHDVIHHTRPDGRHYPAPECPIYKAAHGGPGATVKEELFWRKDGSSFLVDYVTSPLVDHGRVVGAVTVFQDVSQRRKGEAERKQREEALKRAAEALAKSNRELDQFAYVTSHDLKAPLRGIANLSRWIEEDLGSDLRDDTRAHLELMRGRVARMEALIDAILEYSRVGRARSEPKLVDVGEMLKETIDLISPPAGCRILVDEPMPKVIADKARLQQIFLNLLVNAIKHHHRKHDATIRITVEDAGPNHHRFSVSDDGPGIAPQFHDRVFVIFQTLQPRDKVEGTGVGLALVKKIVESQGGTVTLDSDVGRGASFRFTWPKRPD